jgi:hypothetical protein
MYLDCWMLRKGWKGLAGGSYDGFSFFRSDSFCVCNLKFLCSLKLRLWSFGL